MSSERGGFTIRGDHRFVSDSLVIEAGLARALDGGFDEWPSEESLYIDVGSVREHADHLAMFVGPDAARESLLREVRRYTRWLRAVELGLAGNDDEDPRRHLRDLRGNRARVALSAALYGLMTGTPPEQLASEVVAAGALELGEAGQFAVSQLLSYCFHKQQRPDLALSLLIRSPAVESATQHLRDVLDAGRGACANGHVQRVADLLALTHWRSDPTGLERELLHRLVTDAEQKPSLGKLFGRVRARRRAVKSHDWGTLRELALSDVVWLKEDVALWRELSAVLRMTGDVEQADLAHDAAELLAHKREAR